MKLIMLTCPKCGADLKVDSSRKYLYCEYCGQKLIVDDEIKRTEHIRRSYSTHRVIDEARIKEADIVLTKMQIEEQRRQEDLLAEEKRRKRRFRRRLVFAGIICAFIAWILISRAVEDAYYTSIVKRVNETCEKHSVQVTEINLNGRYKSFAILTKGSSRSEIDPLQSELLKILKARKGDEIDLSFYYPDYNLIKDIRVDDKGVIEIYFDNTNTASDKDVTNYIEVYKDELEKTLSGYPVSDLKVTYSNDTLNIYLVSTTYEEKRVTEVLERIELINSKLHKLDLSIDMRDQYANTLRRSTISQSGKIKDTEDKSNKKFTDEEATSIAEEYKGHVLKACENNNATMNRVCVKEDIVYIKIAANYKEKSKVQKLQKALIDSFKEAPKIEKRIDITSDNPFDTTLDFSVDEDGATKVYYDFTK